MATLAATQVSGDGLGLAIPFGALHLEIWRVTGATVGDTTTIAPARGRFVMSTPGFASNLTTTPGTNVTVVVGLTGATAVDIPVLVLD